LRRFSKRVITYPLLVVAGVVLLVEEALWRLSGLLALLGKLPVFHAIEQWIRRVPPWGALALFGIPSIALAPIKFLALYWMAGGHPMLGIGTIITAKVTGTAVVARLFQLTQPQLLTIGWFRWSYEKVMALRAAAYGLWWNSAAGRLWRRLRERSRGWVRRRWDAIRARSKAQRPRES
jgi:hypothetical protein